MLPFLTLDAPWFTFIGHPRHSVDLERIGGTALLRRYSVDEEDFLRKLGLIPPLVIGQITFEAQAVAGEVVAVMCMPNLMVTPRARQAVAEAMRLAIGRGSRVIGLGALTAPATGAGTAVTRELPPGVTLTTGNAYTAVVAYDNVKQACSWMNANDPNIVVVGATGSVGFALSHLLAADGYKLALVGRSEERVRTLLAHLKKYAVQFSGTLSVLQDADITVILTNDPTAAVTPEMFGRRGVIIDVAQPLNIAPTRHKLFKARDLYVCEGGLVKIPGYLCSFDFGLARGTTFACLAETYLFSRDGLTEHSIGRASPELARYLKQLASRYGIGTCALSLNSSAPSSAMPAIA